MPDSDNLRATGDRIASLLEQLLSTTDDRVAGRIEELLRLVTELYGEALARVVAVADHDLLARLAADDLVASLLLVHGLHPETMAERVGTALDGVRPYLGSHGGDVELIGVEGGRVRLAMLGSCDGCPSSAVTLKLAVEQAILAVAPEVEAIEVEGYPEPDRLVATTGAAPAGGPPVGSVPVHLGPKPASNGAATPTAQGARGRPGRTGGSHQPGPEEDRPGPWAVVEGLADLPDQVVKGLQVDGQRLVVCRVGRSLYAYEDLCPACRSGLADATLDGEVLRCGVCRAAFDVRLAGRSLDGTVDHLDPLPLLEEPGGVRIAVAAGAGR